MISYRKILSIKILFLFCTIISIGNVCWGDSQKLKNDIITDITLDKDEFVIGEPITIRVNIKNIGPNTIHIKEIIPEHFNFSAVNVNDRKVKLHKLPSQISRLLSFCIIAPGSDFRDVVFINKILNFQKPGFYKIRFNSILPVYKDFPKNPQNKQEIKLSGNVNIKLLKGSDEELEKAMRHYLEILESEDYRIARRAAQAFTISEPNMAVKLLREALKNEPSNKSLITWALAKIGTDDSIKVLLDAAEYSKNTSIRTSAIEKLGSWHIQSSLPTLLKLLNDENPIIRAKALGSLADFGDERNLPAIQEKFNDSNQKVRESAQKAYNKVVKIQKRKEDNKKWKQYMIQLRTKNK